MLDMVASKGYSVDRIMVVIVVEYCKDYADYECSLSMMLLLIGVQRCINLCFSH